MLGSWSPFNRKLKQISNQNFNSDLSNVKKKNVAIGYLMINLQLNSWETTNSNLKGKVKLSSAGFSLGNLLWRRDARMLINVFIFRESSCGLDLETIAESWIGSWGGVMERTASRSAPSACCLRKIPSTLRDWPRKLTRRSCSMFPGISG